jgi:hypothetical protein
MAAPTALAAIALRRWRAGEKQAAGPSPLYLQAPITGQVLCAG